MHKRGYILPKMDIICLKGVTYLEKNGILSVVIPVYNEADGLVENLQKISQILDDGSIAHALIVVDDGSTDGTWEVLHTAALPQLTAVRLSRNFGKEAAVFAGLEAADGAAVAVMDADLQHPPQLLADMYRLWQQGYEVVEAVKADRGREGWFSRLLAGGFYSVLRLLSGLDLQNSSDFRLLDRKVVDALSAMPERQTFFRGMSAWVGYRRTQVFFDVPPRQTGRSKWSRGKLYRYALSAITAYSSIPMQIVTVAGLFFLAFGIILAAQTLYTKFSGNALDGFTTVILLIIITGSIIMLGLGIIGNYIAKIYEEIKGRPRYLVAEQTKKERTD